MKKIFPIIALYFFCLPSFAFLDPETGNNFVEFIDNDPNLNAGTPLIRRYYNSMSDHKGLFGLGWASDLETRLDFLPDGSVAVIPYGAGRLRLFERSPFKLDSNWKLPQHDTLKQRLVNELTNNKVYRYQWLKDNNYLKKTAPCDISLFAGNESLNCQNGTWTFIDSSGESWKFNNEGRLIAFNFVKGGEWRLSYKNEKLHSIKNSSYEFFTNLTSEGLLQEITLKDGAIKYSFQNGLLISSEDTKKKKFTYSYSSRSQLESLRGDTFDYSFIYHPLSGKLTLMKINGEETKINYDEKKIDSNEVLVITIQKANELEKIEYTYTTNEKGRYLYRLKESSGNTFSETYFNPNRQPLRINESNRQQFISYDQQGRIIEIKTSASTSEKISRDPKTGKILEIQGTSEGRKFTYNQQGKIQSVLFNNGTSLNFTYDSSLLVTSFEIKNANFSEGKLSMLYEGRRVKDLLLNGKKPVNSTDKLLVTRFLQLMKEATSMPNP